MPTTEQQETADILRRYPLMYKRIRHDLRAELRNYRYLSASGRGHKEEEFYVVSSDDARSSVLRLTDASVADWFAKELGNKEARKKIVSLFRHAITELNEETDIGVKFLSAQSSVIRDRTSTIEVPVISIIIKRA